MKRFLHRLAGHTWGEWDKIKTIRTFETSHSAMPYKTRTIYRATCTVCGELKTKKVKL